MELRCRAVRERQPRVEGIAQQIESLPTMHEALGSITSMGSQEWRHTYNPSTQDVETEGSEVGRVGERKKGERKNWNIGDAEVRRQR